MIWMICFPLKTNLKHGYAAVATDQGGNLFALKVTIY